MIGRIHSIDTFSTVDGPGIRTVVFMQGCNLRCKYCQNPDTWAVNSPTVQEMTVQEVISVISRGKPYFEASGGGVTFSGGEPLLQHGFLGKVLKACQENDIHTAVDTSLNVASCKVEEIIPYTRLVLADIKSINSKICLALTGMGNEQNISNLKLLDDRSVPIWIRYVVVPGWTDSSSDVKEMALMLQRLEHIQKIELLPYHTLGIHKWNLLKLDYSLQDISVPTLASLRDLADALSSLSGKPVSIPG
ncbi:pyruvate formate-lyase-activating protein [Syntrophomonas palmitatica]|uniref:pyruvate formate-lyase-activating protein n=1 Tax=Syntrophomonas palmitatica TaxID=402877 RepID=UPI0006D25FB3|nr:pyruvate formate-lyase-activating protein [Syntrophomonas palmitatica]